jgi:hypothetical protein
MMTLLDSLRTQKAKRTPKMKKQQYDDFAAYALGNPAKE